MTALACAQPGCGGTIQDGYCDVCGLAPSPVPAAPAAQAAGWGPASGAASIRYAGAGPGGAAPGGSGPGGSGPGGSGPGRFRVGRGLVNGPGQRRQRQRARHPRLTAGQRPVVAGQARRRARRGAAGPGA